MSPRPLACRLSQNTVGSIGTVVGSTVSLVNVSPKFCRMDEMCCAISPGISDSILDSSYRVGPSCTNCLSNLHRPWSPQASGLEHQLTQPSLGRAGMRERHVVPVAALRDVGL